MEWTLRRCFGINRRIDLEKVLQPPPDHGPLQKCRIQYGEDHWETEWIPYTRSVHSGHRIVDAGSLDYSCKFADRRGIEKLVKSVPAYHDILMVQDGLITDASYSNLVFFDGTDWITPDTPLLRGVMRAALLDAGRIREKRVTRSDLRTYQVFKKINALNPMDFAPVYLVSKIRGN